jgi:hypothetical protein
LEYGVENFKTFLSEVRAASPAMDYSWSKEKEASCDWIIERVQFSGVGKPQGVDVGGTEYICNKLSEKGGDITYFDHCAPKCYSQYICDDMFNFSKYYAEGQLDFITTRHTLEHSLLPLYQLWQYARALKDHGDLFVIVPMYNPQWVWFNTHFSCLPHDSWLMLFYRSGFRLIEASAGTWKKHDPKFLEYRYWLKLETRSLRF